MTGLYFHIPFCASRCIYCGFYSTTLPELQNRYVDALIKEMEIRQHNIPVSTIYLGGGTPSQLTHANFSKLFSAIYKMYSVADNAEVTIECNPDDIKR
ncbi:MAG: radical SAM protein, partial [Prevotellaceae bacterium]|nr:radical SAM protein [Prevotellaceae bacterium]